MKKLLLIIAALSCTLGAANVHQPIKPSHTGNQAHLVGLCALFTGGVTGACARTMMHQISYFYIAISQDLKPGRLADLAFDEIDPIKILLCLGAYKLCADAFEQTCSELDPYRKKVAEDAYEFSFLMGACFPPII